MLFVVCSVLLFVVVCLCLCYSAWFGVVRCVLLFVARCLLLVAVRCGYLRFCLRVV